MTTIVKGSPQTKARMAGVFYLLNIALGASALAVANSRNTLILIAALCYAAVTLVFYDIFKPANKTLSLIAALVSLAGCVLSALDALGLAPLQINSLVFFGGYCLLIGLL